MSNLRPRGDETARQFVDRCLAIRPVWKQCCNRGVDATIYDLRGVGYFRHLGGDYQKLIDIGGVFYWFEGLSFAYTEHYRDSPTNKHVLIENNATPEFNVKIALATFYSTLTLDQMREHCGPAECF